MTISVTKPSINLREKLNELDQPQGLKGTELMRADTVAEARSLIGAGRKNLIINGAMQVAQRGTSFAAIGSEVYTLDRYAVVASVADVAVDQASGTNFDKALKVTGASGNTLMYLMHRIESKSSIHVAGQNVTLSVNIKGSTSKTVTARLSYATATDNFGGTTEIATQSFGVTTTDTQFTHTFSVPAAATTGLEIRLYPSGGLGASETLEFSGLQLELGDTATDFEHRSFGEELALCQRYYENNYWGGYPEAANDDTHNAYGWEGTRSFKVAKRAAPSITGYAPWSGYTAGYWAFFNGGTWVEGNPGLWANAQGFGWSNGGVRHRYPVIGGWEADAEL